MNVQSSLDFSSVFGDLFSEQSTKDNYFSQPLDDSNFGMSYFPSSLEDSFQPLLMETPSFLASVIKETTTPTFNQESLSTSLPVPSTETPSISSVDSSSTISRISSLVPSMAIYPPAPCTIPSPLLILPASNAPFIFQEPSAPQIPTHPVPLSQPTNQALPKPAVSSKSIKTKRKLEDPTSKVAKLIKKQRLEEDKDEIRRARNRLSAKKSRERKNERFQFLESQLEELPIKNAKLQEKIEKAERENQFLKTQLGLR